MLTLKIGLIRLKEITERIKSIKRQHKVWRRHALVSGVVMSLLIATVVFFTGVLYYKNDVLITDNGITKKYFTMKEDSNEILAEFGYSVGGFDRILRGENADGHNSIEIVRGFGVEIIADAGRFMGSAVEGETPHMVLTANSVETGRYDELIIGEASIEVVRGFGVSVTADSQTVTIGTTGSTVGELLHRMGITLGADDIINMPLDSALAQGDGIVINRVKYRDRTDFEPIPYEISIQHSNLMAIGESEVIEGVYGEMTLIYREKLIDGIVVTSQVMSKQISKEPQTELITHGKALRTPYSKRDFPEIKLENGIPVDYVKKFSGKSTAYTAPPTSGTASGRRLEIGTVAVDPAKIPYGSLLYIVNQNGSRVYGAAIAADTGGFILHGDAVIVDVFMGLTSENYHEALRWGAQMVDVYVINSGIY